MAYRNRQRTGARDSSDGNSISHTTDHCLSPPLIPAVTLYQHPPDEGGKAAHPSDGQERASQSIS